MAHKLFSFSFCNDFLKIKSYSIVKYFFKMGQQWQSGGEAVHVSFPALVSSPVYPFHFFAKLGSSKFA